MSLDAISLICAHVILSRVRALNGIIPGEAAAEGINEKSRRAQRKKEKKRDDFKHDKCIAILPPK